jgi:hypothetical protein
LNGSIGTRLPTELTERYPATIFRFARRGEAGADVQVVGGLHPSSYPGSTWEPGNMFGDFKPNTPSGVRTFRYDVKKGKLPDQTQLIPYDPKTGKLN